MAMACAHPRADPELRCYERECECKGERKGEYERGGEKYRDGSEQVGSETRDLRERKVSIEAPEAWLGIYTYLRERAMERAMARFDFGLFMKLPREVRDIVYGYVLANGNPILPHLCDERDSIENPTFHDDNDKDHASLFKLTSLTRASKKLREECLTIFYAANSFAVGPDTATYFTYLESTGRLEWILHVNLVVRCGPANRAAWILRRVNQFDEEAESHQKNGCKSVNRGFSHHRVWNNVPHCTESTVVNTIANDYEKKKPLSTHDLMQHSRYHVGGFTDLNLVILLRMLSTATPPGSKYPRRIVLPVSNTRAFNIDASLRWFPSVVQGLGMELRFVERPDTATLHNRNVLLQWNRRYQGQDVVSVAAPDGEDVLKRALEMFPGMEQMRRPEMSSYYRRSCHSGQLTWFDMSTLGGAHA